jgi:hypothetical protein
LKGWGGAVTFVPIFIVGVPRSSNTLLCLLLDCRSPVLALAETPGLAQKTQGGAWPA